MSKRSCLSAVQSVKLLVLVMVMFLTSLQLAQCQGKFRIYNNILSLMNSLIIDINYSTICYTWNERFQDFRLVVFFLLGIRISRVSLLWLHDSWGSLLAFMTLKMKAPEELIH